MLQNKKYAGYAIPLIVVLFFLFAAQSTLTTGQLNVVTPFMSATYGWTDTLITMPTTIGGFIMIPGYFLVAAILAIITILCIIFIKNSPEDVSLFPDGKSTAPSNADISDEISIKELLSNNITWRYIVGSGLLNFIICASGAFLVVRFISVGGTAADGLKAMTIGSLMGIPMSYIFGWIDDKIGSVKAMSVLAVTYLIHLVPLTIMKSPEMSIIILAAFGMACMTGGLPTLDPSVVAFLYGRKKYQAANKTLMTIKGVIMAFAVYYMAAFSTAGHLTWAFVGLCIMVCLAFIIFLSMHNVPDADIADRSYGKK